MHYKEMRQFSRAVAAVKRIAARRGYHGSIHAASRVETLRRQLDALDIFLDARKAEPTVPDEWLWELALSVVTSSEQGRNDVD